MARLACAVALQPLQSVEGTTYLSQRGDTKDIQSTSWPLMQKQLSLTFKMGSLYFYVSQRCFNSATAADEPSLYLGREGH